MKTINLYYPTKVAILEVVFSFYHPTEDLLLNKQNIFSFEMESEHCAGPNSV